MTLQYVKPLNSKVPSTQLKKVYQIFFLTQVDFGLLDKKGNLIENPIHYRDLRTKGMIEESSKYINPHDFYQMTGNQFMEINTVFQLLSLQKITS